MSKNEENLKNAIAIQSANIVKIADLSRLINEGLRVEFNKSLKVFVVEEPELRGGKPVSVGGVPVIIKSTFKKADLENAVTFLYGLIEKITSDLKIAEGRYSQCLTCRDALIEILKIEAPQLLDIKKEVESNVQLEIVEEQ